MKILANYVKINGEVKSELIIPADFVLVSSETHERDGEQVKVERYQKNQEIIPNNAHVTVIFGADGRLISYDNLVADPTLELPSKNGLEVVGTRIWMNLDLDYAAELHFMRIETQQRSYLDDDGNRQSFDVQWVKYTHDNGTYNWVTIGPGNQILEVEREAQWDYLESRRTTEAWNSEDWVLAREGKGPQLEAPNALA